MSNLPEQTTPVYATDEDIAVRASGRLCHALPGLAVYGVGRRRHLRQRLAVGPDSTSINFATNGVTPNHVVLFSGGTPRARSPAAASSWRSIPYTGRR